MVVLGHWNAHFEKNLAYMTTQLHLLYVESDVVTRVAPFRLRKVKVGELVEKGESAPALDLPHNEMEMFLQAFMNAVWEYGIRPKGISELNEVLAAKEKNLDDLRLINIGLMQLLGLKIPPVEDEITYVKDNPPG